MKYTVLLMVSFCLASFMADAQNPQWYIPQNINLVSAQMPQYTRYDDTWFISRDTGFVVSGNGFIYKTHDGANSWAPILQVDPDIYFRSIEFTDNGQVGIAGTLSGFVFRTTDRGETWANISGSIADTGVYHRMICGLAHWGNTFYGVGWWGSNVARFYKSTDLGQTWSTSYIDTTLASGLVDIICLSADTIFATGYHESLSGIEESVVIRSADAGQTWQTVFQDSTIGGRIWKIQFIDHNIGVGSIEPIFHDTVAMIKTTDGGNTWNIIPIGHRTSYSWGTQGIGFATTQKGWVGGYYQGLFHTNDGGQTWDSLSIGFNFDRFFRIDSNLMYASGAEIYKFADSALLATGVKSPSQTTQFSHKLYPISPNPSTGKVTIEFDLGTLTNVRLEVVGMDARKIFPVTNGYLKPGHYSYTWDGSNMPNGNYLIWLGTDEIPVVEKFVIAR